MCVHSEKGRTQVMQHSSALFVVFVMFVVLRDKKISGSSGADCVCRFYARACELALTGVLPVLSFKRRTPRTPRTMPMDIGEIVFVVQQATSKPRTSSSRRAMHDCGMPQPARWLCGVSCIGCESCIDCVHGPLGHFRVKPFLWTVALLKECPQFR